jgi:hypothetical protein
MAEETKQMTNYSRMAYTAAEIAGGHVEYEMASTVKSNSYSTNDSNVTEEQSETVTSIPAYYAIIMPKSPDVEAGGGSQQNQGASVANRQSSGPANNPLQEQIVTNEQAIPTSGEIQQGDNRQGGTQQGSTQQEGTKQGNPQQRGTQQGSSRRRGTQTNREENVSLTLCRHFCMSAVKCVVGIFFFFVYYFVWFPIAGFKYFVPGSKGSTRWRRFTSVSTMLALLLGSVLYGVFQDLRGSGWSFDHFLSSNNDLYVIGARASGKLATVFVIAGLVFTLRPFTSAINEIPHYKRNNTGWRRVHVDLFLLSMVFGVVHTVLQVKRMREFPTDFVYETYFLVSGSILWAIYATQGMPYFFISIAQNMKDDHPWRRFWKWFFRLLHVYMYPIFIFVYLFHTGSFFPIAIYLIWVFVHRRSTFEIKDAYYCFEGEGKHEALSLLIFVSNEKIPFEFGLYCQVEVAGIVGSYTMIPMDKALKHGKKKGKKTSSDAELEASGVYLQFIIRPCVLTDALKKRLEDEDESTRYKEKHDKMFQKSFKTLPFREVGLEVSGPYHSTDMGIKDNSARNLVVITGSAGISVAVSVLMFSLCHTFWRKLVIIIFGGTTAPSDAVADKLSNADIPILITQKAGISAEEQAAGVWKHVKEKIEGNTDSIVSYQVYGKMGDDMMLDLFLTLNSKDIHFLVCGSRIYGQIVDAIKLGRKSEKMDGEILSRIHNEEFQIEGRSEQKFWDSKR